MNKGMVFMCVTSCAYESGCYLACMSVQVVIYALTSMREFLFTFRIVSFVYFVNLIVEECARLKVIRIVLFLFILLYFLLVH